MTVDCISRLNGPMRLVLRFTMVDILCRDRQYEWDGGINRCDCMRCTITCSFITVLNPQRPTCTLLFPGIIHGDFNEQNVLVRLQPQSTDVDIVGIIDFGDSHHGPYVFELAIAVTYCMLQSRVVDPLDVCGHLVAGYLSGRQRALSDAERAALWPSVAARFAQSLTIGAYTYSLDPSNAYVLATAKRGWTLLRQMWKETSRQRLETTLDVVLNGYGYRLPAA